MHSQKVDLALRGNVAIEGFWCYYQRKNGRKDAWSLLLCRISLGLDLGRGISHALNLAQRISVPNLARPESRLPNLGPESRTPFRISLRTTNRMGDGHFFDFCFYSPNPNSLPLFNVWFPRKLGFRKSRKPCKILPKCIFLQIDKI